MSNEKSLFEKPRMFDGEYTLKFILMILIAIGIIFLCWTYSFKNNMIISINETNEKIFNEKFSNLSVESEPWGNYNISNLGQKVISLKTIDRSNYSINMAAFGSLPLIPEDWGKMKYLFDQGREFVLPMINESYYKQPEFYDDWNSMGLPFFKKHDMECSSGVFAEPFIQKIYTTHGSSLNTYSFVRSSFCDVDNQAFSLFISYPSTMTDDMGNSYTQNGDIVKKYITVKTTPDVLTLGAVYPKFSKNWVSKVKITVSVADNTPKGIYVVAIGTDKYVPLFGKLNNVNYDAYKSKSGNSLMHLILAVD